MAQNQKSPTGKSPRRTPAVHQFVPGVREDAADPDRPWQSMHGRTPVTPRQRATRAAQRVVDLTTPVDCEQCPGCVDDTPCPLQYRK